MGVRRESASPRPVDCALDPATGWIGATGGRAGRGEGFVLSISEETLGDHDAEYMLVEVCGVEATLNDLLLRSADGVTAYVYGWGENVVGAFRIITDLRRILLDDDEPIGPDGQLEIWNEFLAP